MTDPKETPELGVIESLPLPEEKPTDDTKDDSEG